MGYFDVDLLALQFRVPQQRPQLFPRPFAAFLLLSLVFVFNLGRSVIHGLAVRRHDESGIRRHDFIAAWKEQIEQAFLDARLGRLLHVVFPFRADHVDRNVDEVAHHRLDVAAHVPDFGELRGLDLDERCARQPRQASRDLRLPDAGRPDHDDVVGHDLLAEIFPDLLAAPAVAECDSHGLLGRLLRNNVLVQFGDDLPRRQFIVWHDPTAGLIVALAGSCLVRQQIAHRFGVSSSSTLISAFE